MGNSKHSFLKQWFTFKFEDDSTNLLYSCTNNHYIHSWFERSGHTSFTTVLDLKDYDLFIQAINESTNMIPDDFNTHFPDYFIEDYSLWNMDTCEYWNNVSEYREHCKSEMEKLFDILCDYNEDMENGSGILTYHIYYSH